MTTASDCCGKENSFSAFLANELFLMGDGFALRIGFLYHTFLRYLRTPRLICSKFHQKPLDMHERSSILVCMNKLSKDKRARVIAALVEGNSLRATAPNGGGSYQYGAEAVPRDRSRPVPSIRMSISGISPVRTSRR